MADGLFYNDLRTPFNTSDVAAVTLAATAKALYPVERFPALGAGYFNQFTGKKIAIHLFGKITTALTPGNGSFDVYFGNGTDANGTLLASSAAVALSASQTNVSWSLDIIVSVRVLGASGSLFVTGEAHFNVGVLASTLQPLLIPASAAVSVGADLTTSNIISVQFKRSGSTAETMAVQEMTVTVLN